MTMCPAFSFLHSGHTRELCCRDGEFGRAAAAAGITAGADVRDAAGSGAAAARAPGALLGAGARELGASCVLEVVPAAHAIGAQSMCIAQIWQLRLDAEGQLCTRLMCAHIPDCLDATLSSKAVEATRSKQ